MLLDAEEDAACARFSGGTLFLDIRPAGVVHRCDPLPETYWPNDEDTESISTHPAIAKQVFFCLTRRGRARIMTCVAAKRIAIAEKSNAKRAPTKR